MLAARMLTAAAGRSGSAYANTSVLDVSQVPAHAMYYDGTGGGPIAAMDATLGVPTFATSQTYQNCVVLTALPTASVFRITADLELVSDAAGYEHMGLWPSDGNNWEGYRAAHLNNTGSPTYLFSKWTSATQASAETSVNITLDTDPAWSVGSRGLWVLTRDASGVFSLSVDGQHVFSVTDTTYAQLRPGLHLYGCEIALYGLTYEYN